MKRRAAALTALALLLGASAAAGQVTALRALDFGTITSGTATSVSKTSASSAQWSFTGAFPLGGSFSFTLPTALSGPGSPIALTFGTSDGQRSTSNNPTTGSSFNPHTSQSIGITLGTTVYVWLGASVSPPLNQQPGTYNATVVLTTTGML